MSAVDRPACWSRTGDGSCAAMGMMDATPNAPHPQRETAIGTGSSGTVRPAVFHRRSTYLLLLFLTLRLSLVLITTRNPQGGLTLDSPSYVDLARTLRLEGTYTHPNGIEDLRRPPIYPAYLAIFTSAGGLNERGAVFGQLLLLSVSSVLLLVVLNHLGYPTAGLAAAWLTAVSPNANLWALTVMSETLFAFLLVAAFGLLSLRLKRPTSWLLVGSGLVLGLATLTRPVAVAIVVLWPLVVGYIGYRRWVPTLTPSAAIWIAVGSALVILPWMARNARVHQQFSVSDVAGSTLESFNFAIVVAQAEGITRNDATLELGERGGTWDQFRWVVSTYPLPFALGQVGGVARVVWGNEITRWATVLGVSDWEGFGVFRYLSHADFSSAWRGTLETLGEASQRTLLLIYLVSLAHVVALVGLALIGSFRIPLGDGTWRSLVLLCAATVVSLILVNGAAGQARFRVPVEAFAAVLAGLGWTVIARRRQPPIGETVSGG